MSYDYRLNIENKHNLKDINKCKSIVDNNQTFEQLKREGEGYTGIVYKIESSECGTTVLKKYKKIKSVYEKRQIYTESWILKRTNKLIEDNICPNFIYLHYTNVKSTSDANKLKDTVNKINEKHIF